MGKGSFPLQLDTVEQVKGNALAGAISHVWQA